MLQKRLEQMLMQKKKIEIIESTTFDQDLVNIGDIIQLEFKYDDGDTEVEEVRLTGYWKVSSNDSIQEVSLNSPLGRAIYLQKIGSMVNYSVNDQKIFIQILSK